VGRSQAQSPELLRTEFNYARVLTFELEDDPPKRKGERTRLRLKAAAARVLERIGYRDMRVSDICDEAGSALASFYFHFENKTQITREVLAEFLDYWNRIRPRPAEGGTFAAMCDANYHFILAFEANAGLMRCLLQLGDDVPEFQSLWQERSGMWLKGVSRSLVKRGEAAPNDPSLLLRLHILGGAIDQLLRDLYVVGHDKARELVAEVAPTNKDLAIFVSRLWYRALFGRDPD